MTRTAKLPQCRWKTVTNVTCLVFATATHNHHPQMKDFRVFGRLVCNGIRWLIWSTNQRMYKVHRKSYSTRCTMSSDKYCDKNGVAPHARIFSRSEKYRSGILTSDLVIRITSSLDHRIVQTTDIAVSGLFGHPVIWWSGSLDQRITEWLENIAKLIARVLLWQLLKIYDDPVMWRSRSQITGLLNSRLKALPTHLANAIKVCTTLFLHTLLPQLTLKASLLILNRRSISTISPIRMIGPRLIELFVY